MGRRGAHGKERPVSVYFQGFRNHHSGRRADRGVTSRLLPFSIRHSHSLAIGRTAEVDPTRS